jgi:hypothetical protein
VRKARNASVLITAAVALLALPAAATANLKFVLRTPGLGVITENTPIGAESTSATLVTKAGNITCGGTRFEGVSPEFEGFTVLRSPGPSYYLRYGEDKTELHRPPCSGDIGLGQPGPVIVTYGRAFLLGPNGKTKAEEGSGAFGMEFPESGGAECHISTIKGSTPTFVIGAHGSPVPLVLHYASQMKRDGTVGSPLCPKTGEMQTDVTISTGGEQIEVEKAK